jgi:hypothetical protein
MPTFYSEEQRIDYIRLKRYIEREQLRSVMSDTRWSKAYKALQSIPDFRVRFRVKDVRGDDPPGDWEGWFPLHVPPGPWIEWLDIDPFKRTYRGALIGDLLKDRSAEIENALHTASVPFTRENGAIRIWGYTRPGASPEFVPRP